MLNLKDEIFIIYIISILKSIKIMIYSFKKAQITFLSFKNIIIFIKYFNSANIFFI